MRRVIWGVVLLAGFAARAEDTKAPAISDVKAAAKGGRVSVEARITDETGVLSAICHHRGPGGRFEDSPMTKDDYDDVFKVSFPGGADTEYWIEASDLLGNGPSMHGSQGKPFAANGKPSGGSIAKGEPTVTEEAPRPARTRKPPK